MPEKSRTHIDSNPKVLLIGPRGGGKSSELQAIRRELRSRFWVLGFDVDASGLSAANVSAFDILYLTSLCFLRCLRQLAPQEDAEALYRDLAQAYFESERSVGGPDALLPAPTENPEPRPSLDEALSGLADFADTAMAVAPQALPMIAPIGLVARMGSMAVRLATRSTQVVSESSPRGLALMKVCSDLSARVRRHLGDSPFCVLVDGLEKMNGESAERFKAMFERTRLIANAPFPIVFAAPPCTLTETHSALGYELQAVYGFPPSDVGRFRCVIDRRLELEGATNVVSQGAVEALVQRSGSLPRHLLTAFSYAIDASLKRNSDRLEIEDANEGLLKLGRELALGLNSGHYGVLRRVHARHELPSEPESAALFSNGRILALPPTGRDVRVRSEVHPLLLDALAESPS